MNSRTETGMITRKRLLLFIPLAVLASVTLFIIALPGLVSSAKHRATIEALASSLTGRQVHINGKLSLALLPAPQLIAGQITISSLAAGPAAETITARSLTLNIAVGALLKGRLQASSITLISPSITIPWPLPRGAQPNWLAALHAQIVNGRVALGALSFTHVSADIFTGAGGAVSGSGSFLASSHPLTLSLSVGAKDATGNAAVTIDALSHDAAAAAHFAGTLNAAGELTATASFHASPPDGDRQVTGTATIKMTESGIQITDLHLRQGAAELAGTVMLAFAPEFLDATLSGQNLPLAQIQPWLGSAAGPPARLDLTASNTSIAGVVVPLLHLTAQAGAAGITVNQLGATLAGGADVTAQGAIDPGGRINGAGHFDAVNAAGLELADGGFPLPPAWQMAHLTAILEGDATHLRLNQLHGSIGPSHVTGTLLFTAGAAAGALHFDQLDLSGLPIPRTAPLLSPAMAWDGEITADHVNFGKLALSHVLLDASWGRELTIRQISAALAGGIIASSLEFAPGGIMSARGVLIVPSAAPLLPLLPAALRPPLTLAQAPFTVSMLARGPVSALASSAVATLGDVSVTASPVIDLTHLTAAGALTLRHPNAIAALAAFGLKTGLAWPGAGSISLAAEFSASPENFALPDFVLSLGDLTANGSIAVNANHQISADIDADTLALPPLEQPAIPWAALADVTGTIKLSAVQVLLGGVTVLGQGSASLTLAPNLLSFAVPDANLANGHLSGSLTAATSATAPPNLTAKFTLTGADAAGIHLPLTFPITVPAGKLDAAANLTAAGYTPGVWAATVAGPVRISANNGTLTGFSLAGMAAALASPHRTAALRSALAGGATPYTKLEISGAFQNGNYTIANAGLTGPSGAAGATGSVDLADQALALNFSFAPAVSPPLTINMASIGAWKSPKRVPALGDALHWKQAR